MKPDALDDLLADWHRWAKGYRIVAQPSACAMFRQAKSPRGWDSTDDIHEQDVQASTMEAIDFQVYQMDEPYKAAIHAHARNLAVGRTVWSTPRLPADPTLRAQIVAKARQMLKSRLIFAGVAERG